MKPSRKAYPVRSVPSAAVAVTSRVLRLPAGWVLEWSVLSEADGRLSAGLRRQLAWGLALRRPSLWPQLQSGTE